MAVAVVLVLRTVDIHHNHRVMNVEDQPTAAMAGIHHHNHNISNNRHNIAGVLKQNQNSGHHPRLLLEVLRQ
jgi:hypothetical protein